MTDSKKTTSNYLLHVDRCINPLKRENHKGSGLRKISKTLLKQFPQIPENSRICDQCRKMCNENTVTSNQDNSLTEEPESKRKCLSREDQLEQLLSGIKEKFSSLPKNNPLRMSILTIVPECWSVRQIASEFGTSERQARQAKHLRNVEGVLATPESRRGKTLPEETVNKVQEFYECDQNSRIMPGKKDTVSTKVNGEKRLLQKRLLLVDIKILHTQFKEQYPEFPIGLSKFADLRPKNCVCAGSAGTQSVCVCLLHQNFKLMIDSVNFEKLVPDSENVICTLCPGLENFSNTVSILFEENEISEIICSCWQSTDRCTLTKIYYSSKDFVSELSTQLRKLLPHHYIAKNQSEYYQERKRNLQEGEVILQCDFSENYAYVAQDAVQGFHYNNDQCTVHPAIFYYKENGEIKHCSIVLLSECTTHDTAAVYILQQTVISEIKKVYPNVKKIIYFTDGAKQHYKNKYQMINLVHHEEDFNVLAEWHFHATAHGKGACDGIGAVLKREATRASLQAKPENAILNAKNLFNWAKEHIKTTRFFYYTKQQHAKSKRSLAKRFSLAPSVTKIQSAHSFIVTSEKKVEVFRYSNASAPLAVIQY